MNRQTKSIDLRRRVEWKRQQFDDHQRGDRLDHTLRHCVALRRFCI